MFQQLIFTDNLTGSEGSITHKALSETESSNCSFIAVWSWKNTICRLTDSLCETHSNTHTLMCQSPSTHTHIYSWRSQASHHSKIDLGVTGLVGGWWLWLCGRRVQSEWWWCWGGRFGGEVLQAVLRGGRVHTACLHTSIAVTGRYRGLTWGCQVWRHTRLPSGLILLVVASSGFLHFVNGVL